MAALPADYLASLPNLAPQPMFHRAKPERGKAVREKQRERQVGLMENLQDAGGVIWEADALLRNIDGTRQGRRAHRGMVLTMIARLEKEPLA